MEARLTIHLSSDSRWHHRPVYAEIVHRAHRAGLAGATVFRGIAGFGPHLHVHDQHRRLGTVSQAPCAVVIVDEERRVRDFLDELEDILSMGGVAVIDRVRTRVPDGTARRPGGNPDGPGGA